MTHERDQAHALTSSGPSADLDADLAPGRAARTDHLLGPTGPRPSGLLMRKAAGTVAPEAEQAVNTASTSAGEQLPGDLRTRFEGSLGTDLSGVRVHTGAASANAADAVGARAYATGNDIHFAAGEYQPHSPAGQELIAHEVAHTVQQRGGSPTQQFKLAVSSAGDHAEVEADRAASAMMSGAAFSVGGTGSGLYREEAKKGPLSESLSITKNSAKLTLKAGLSHDFKVGYVVLTPGGNATVDATLSPKKAVKEGEKLDPADDPKAHLEEATTAGNASLKKEIEDWLGEPAPEETGWETPELEGDTKQAVGLSMTCNLNFRGKKIAVKVTALELAKGEYPKALVTEVDLPVKRKAAQLWENDRFKLDAAATLTLTGSIGPNWEKIWPKLVQTVGPKLRPLMTQMLESVTAEAVTTVAFAAIAATTLAALYLGAKQLSDLAEAEAAAKARVAAFGDGFSTALDVPRSTSQDAVGLGMGMAQAQTTMAKGVAAIQANPLFASYGFSPAELQEALRTAIKPHVPELTTKVLTQARDAIYRNAAKTYYDNVMASTFGTCTNAQLLAARLGVLDAIPPRKD